MKRTISMLMIVSVFVIGALNSVVAQTSQNSFTFAGVVNPKTADNDPLAGISKRAVSNFRKTFNGVTGESWTATKDGGFVAKFSTGDAKTRVFYNKYGMMLGIIRNYEEEFLPKNIRHLVKSTYYDFGIFHISEVIKDGQIIWLLTLEGENSWKQIKVAEGDMTETRNYIKG